VIQQKKYQVALVGLGRAGRFHIQSLQAISGMRLAHVIDTDPERAEEVALDQECQWSTNLDAILESPDIDAVIVASPTREHFSQIMMALDAGKAVFTEKPLGASLPEIDACFNQASSMGLPLFVGFNRRFDPSFASLAEKCHMGAVGIPQFIRITSRDSPLPSVDYIRQSHGIFHDCIVHDLDMLRFITKEDPLEIYALGSSFIDGIGALNDYDNVLVTLRYPGGLLASIDVNRFAAYGYDQRIEVFGNSGMVQAENRAPTSTVLSHSQGIVRPPIEYSFPSRYRDAYRLEMERFLTCLQHNQPAPISHHEVRMSFILCESAEQSCRESRPIRMDALPISIP
jgi:myo-inositol 2-dehydrogenase / D-chiro-inositol 1-dehydrogenase